MKNNIYFNIYVRKENRELFDELTKGISKKQSIDEKALLTIKSILASRQLTALEQENFDNLTQGESFEKISHVEVYEQSASYPVVIEKPQLKPEFNWVRHTFGAISYLVLKYIYFKGHSLSLGLIIVCYLLGILVYEIIAYIGVKLKL